MSITQTQSSLPTLVNWSNTTTTSSSSTLFLPSATMIPANAVPITPTSVDITAKSQSSTKLSAGLITCVVIATVFFCALLVITLFGFYRRYKGRDGFGEDGLGRRQRVYWDDEGMNPEDADPVPNYQEFQYSTRIDNRAYPGGLEETWIQRMVTPRIRLTDGRVIRRLEHNSCPQMQQVARSPTLVVAEVNMDVSSVCAGRSSPPAYCEQPGISPYSAPTHTLRPPPSYPREPRLSDLSHETAGTETELLPTHTQSNAHESISTTFGISHWFSRSLFRTKERIREASRQLDTEFFGFGLENGNNSRHHSLHESFQLDDEDERDIHSLYMSDVLVR